MELALHSYLAGSHRWYKQSPATSFDAWFHRYLRNEFDIEKKWRENETYNNITQQSQSYLCSGSQDKLGPRGFFSAAILGFKQEVGGGVVDDNFLNLGKKNPFL